MVPGTWDKAPEFLSGAQLEEMPLPSKHALARSREQLPDKCWPRAFAGILPLDQVLEALLTESVVARTISGECSHVLEHALLPDPARVSRVKFNSVRCL